MDPPSSQRHCEHEFGNAASERHPFATYPTHLVQSHPTAPMSDLQTIYIPIASPPTPAPSPGPTERSPDPLHPLHFQQSLSSFRASAQNPNLRRKYIISLLSFCEPSELLFISQTIQPLLKRDFFFDLPVELALNILSFIDDPKTLIHASQVSRHWYRIVRDESVWKGMCFLYEFDDWAEAEAEWYRLERLRPKKGKGKGKEKQTQPQREYLSPNSIPDEAYRELKGQDMTPSISISSTRSSSPTLIDLAENLRTFSFRRHFRESFIIRTNWRHGGKLLGSHRVDVKGSDSGTVTSLAIDPEWVVVGLANNQIQVYSAQTGVLARTLKGHEAGVWGVCLVSAGGSRLHKKSERASDGEGESASLANAEPQQLKNMGKNGWKQKKGSTNRWKGKSTTKSQPKQSLPADDHSAESGARKPIASAVHAPAGGVAALHLNAGHIQEGTHVMPSESFAHLIPPSMQIVLGLDPKSFADSSGQESSSSGEDGHDSSSESVFDEDAAERGAHTLHNFHHHHQQQQHEEGSREKGKTKQHHIPEEEEEDAAPTDEFLEALEKPFNMCYSSRGWGQPNPIVVSGGCDKVLRVWDVITGQCIYVLHGHMSTIRSLRVLNNRPIAVTGSRDATLRVWDVQMGRCLRVLEGHTGSVRCLDVFGNRVVSGSYDNSCRLWNIDTGECIHVLGGHFSQIYSVAFDGVRIASGGLDTTVRIWDPETGRCIAILQGHTALVCQMQLSPTILATGGSDGRVITFSLSTYKALHRIAAHDSSVTSLQFDKNFLVTGGNDGRVRLFETQTGNFIRELSAPSESVWKAAFVKDTCAIMCKRNGKRVVEIWTLNPRGNRQMQLRKRLEAKTQVEW